MQELNHISEAEWQIMRAVWAKVPGTSSEIIKELNESTGWEPTTVKTMLSRLVKKGILRFEVKGRTYYYYPLISEQECIRMEMRVFVEKIYGGALHKETARFRFKGNRALEYIDLLAYELENNYERISKDLEHTLPEKILVYTHSTQQRLHSALGVLNGPAWLRAGYTWGILHMAPKECFTEIKAEKAAVHTLTQIMINQINETAPYWLQQAVSAYEGQWMTKDRIRNAVCEKYGKPDDSLNPGKDDLTQMNDMSKHYELFKESRGYEIAYTVAEFIVEGYGFPELVRLLKEPTNFQGVFQLSETEFWGAWGNFINRKYVQSER